jgi:hypothetical protein
MVFATSRSLWSCLGLIPPSLECFVIVDREEDKLIIL